MAHFVTDHGWTANQVTVFGFVVGLFAIPAIAFEAYLVGLALILLNRLADGLDGAVARRTVKTDRGGFLDITLDFIFYSSVPFAFALADPFENALAAAFLIFSFIGTGCSFLAYAIMAEKRGLSTDIRGQKSLYYLGGLTGGNRDDRFVRGLLPLAGLVSGFGCDLRSTLLGDDRHQDHAGWQRFD